MRRGLSVEDLGDLLSQPKAAILATRSAGGGVLLSPVWHEWSEGRFAFVVHAENVKLRQMTRDPMVSIIVADDAPPYRGIEVRGEAKVVEGDPVSTLRRLAGRYLGPGRVDAYMEKWGAFPCVLVSVKADILRTWDYADETW